MCKWLTWQDKWADKIDFYYHLFRTKNLKEEDKEPCVDGFEFYIEAYNELSTCRNSGLGLTPIPFTAIVEYAKIYNIDDDDFHYIIRRMDNCLIDIDSKKGKNNGPKPKDSKRN